MHPKARPASFVVDTATTGEEALRLLREIPVDVIVLDIHMGDENLDGIETAEAIVQTFPDAKIIILTMEENERFIYEFLKIGVRGYIMKNKGIEELLIAIESVMEGEIYLGEVVQKKYFQSLRNTYRTPKIELTKREKQVLSLIGKGHTTPEIANQINIATTTVDKHRSNILGKLGLRNILEIVRYAVENGYVDK
ncbi:MAG: response regulator transcription factor [Bacteroidota bacterium]